MRILYISHYAGSFKHGMEFRPYYLAKEWLKLGHDVHVVAASYSHLRQFNPTLIDDYCDDVIDKVTYTLCKTPIYKGNGVRRFLNILTFLYRLVGLKRRLILQKWHPDLVIASSTYPLDMLCAFKIAQTFNAQLIYEVHDLWPLTLVEVARMSSFHPFVLLLQWAENFAYQKADKVISMLPNAKTHMLEHGMLEKKYVVIPNGVSLEEWKLKKLASEHQLFFKKLRRQYRFLLGYLGSCGLANALDSLVEAMAFVDDPSIGVVLVGEGSCKQDLIQQAKARGLQHIHFYPAVQKQEVPAILNQFDALYLGWKKLPIYRFGINPNKLFDYMMASKPILHAALPDYDLALKAECGFSVEPENSQAISEGILQLSQLGDVERKKMASAGKRYVRKNHDYKKLAEQFLGHCEKR